MSFTVPADAYDRFMGRYADVLAPPFAGYAEVGPGMKVLDVGSGPGALTTVLANVVGDRGLVAAAEPSPTFAAACAIRVPGVDVKEASAESLPWDDSAFDVAIAQLVVHFMADPAAGVAEMHRVVKPGGVVAACTWDMDGGMTMLHAFWEAAVSLDSSAPGEGARARFGRPDVLRELWVEAGLSDISVSALDVEVGYENFEDFWRPFTAGVGPVGSHYASLEPPAQDALREECRRRVGNPGGMFRLGARAWAVRGERPGAV